eukprot:CAMPEP_0167789128 /NCGR_PEP_ID=MMETSP0111_2-20121227/10492_1 /TAXON_ID=91324 /ORGANISM="Lotharella globosa, Strain CCCM811" /LENGTH=328 /DNA_ID=CAMNT_0007681219 /DNA_START=114 /DNA_END=1100 /DNA_ORIENTATION=+
MDTAQRKEEIMTSMLGMKEMGQRSRLTKRMDQQKEFLEEEPEVAVAHYEKCIEESKGTDHISLLAFAEHYQNGTGGVKCDPTKASQLLIKAEAQPSYKRYGPKITDIRALSAFFPLMDIAICRLSVGDVKNIIGKLNKVVVNVGGGLTLLHQAAQADRPDIIELLHAQGHPTESRTCHGETPLDQAAWRGHVDSTLSLLAKKADINSRTNLGYTPLHRAAFYNHTRLAALLSMAGADRTLRDFKDKETPYEVAVKQGNLQVARLLKPTMENGKDVSGLPYARNNPNHPNHCPEGFQSLLRIHALEKQIQSRSKLNSSRRRSSKVAMAR